MTPQQKQKMNARFRETLRPRTGEPGLPYFNILYKTVEKPVIVEKPIQPQTYKDSIGDKVMNWIVLGTCGACGIAIIAIVIRAMIGWAR